MVLPAFGEHLRVSGKMGDYGRHALNEIQKIDPTLFPTQMKEDLFFSDPTYKGFRNVIHKVTGMPLSEIHSDLFGEGNVIPEEQIRNIASQLDLRLNDLNIDYKRSKKLSTAGLWLSIAGAAIAFLPVIHDPLLRLSIGGSAYFLGRGLDLANTVKRQELSSEFDRTYTTKVHLEGQLNNGEPEEIMVVFIPRGMFDPNQTHNDKKKNRK
jgi:hypothetical protein